MPLFRSPLAALVAGTLLATFTSCANRPKMTPSAPAPQPASAQRVAAIRQHYQSFARVGVVTATLPDRRLAAVGEVPVQDFADGDIVTFIDADENVLTVGVVVNRTQTAVHVQYDPPLQRLGRREPRVGDLAVRYSSAAPTLMRQR